MNKRPRRKLTLERKTSSHSNHSKREPERIQKVLSRQGVGSRREIESWIEQGRIKVNDKQAKLGDKINGSERLKLDNNLLRLNLAPQRTRILMYHKPAGVVCTRKDPEGRPTVFQQHRRLANKRWVMIGRLDFNTAGLLLFTNDGELANKLMHPSYEIEREYAVRILGEASQDQLRALKKGVKLEDGLAKFESIVEAGGQGKNHWYHVILKEGRNREVRRLWDSQDLLVTRLIRIRFGTISLPRALWQNKLVELSPEEINTLMI